MALATWLNGHGYSHVTADDVILAFNGAVSRSCPAGVVEALGAMPTIGMMTLHNAPGSPTRMRLPL